MGIPILIEGESGSGKSTSLRKFAHDEIALFNVASKPLPFRGKFDRQINNATYATIRKGLQDKSVKSFVIDDSQYLMAFELFDRAKDTGYGKFTDIAVNFRNLIKYIVEQTPPDVTVYFLHHIEQGENGKIKAKTSGKMIDSQLTLEGLFSIVLLCEADGQAYRFITQSDGTTTKSPMDMFPLEIDNDLKAVDKAVREYWEL